MVPNPQTSNQMARIKEKERLASNREKKRLKSRHHLDLPFAGKANSAQLFKASLSLLAVEEVLDERLHLRDARRAADQDDLVDLRLLQARVIHDVLHRAEGLLEEVAAELLEPRPGQRLGEVLAVEEGLNLEAGLVRRGQRALRLLDFLAQLLQRALVLGHVLAGLLVEDLDEVLHDTLVEVPASQVRGRRWSPQPRRRRCRS